MPSRTSTNNYSAIGTAVQNNPEKFSAPGAENVASDMAGWVDDLLEEIRTGKFVVGSGFTEEEAIEQLDKLFSPIAAEEASATDFDKSESDEPSPICQNEVEVDKSAPPRHLPICQNQGGVFDKSAKPKRYVSAFRDAMLFRAIRDFYDREPVGSARSLLVYSTALSPSSSSLAPSSPSPSLSPTSAEEAMRDALSWRRRGHEPWFTSIDSGQPLPPPARQYRAPAAWRDLSDEALCTLWHVALKASGPTYGFTLNLSPEIEEAARAQPSPVSWLQKRIASKLKDALDRTVEFHMALDEAQRGHRLHIHGEMGVTPGELEAAKAALRRAGGKWDAGAAQKQVDTVSDPDFGWANYMATKCWRIRATRGRTGQGVDLSDRALVPDSLVTFSGDQLACTQRLNAFARALYEAQTKLVDRLR